MKKILPQKQEALSAVLQGLLADLKKEFGDGSIMTLGQTPRVDVEVIPSGAPSLDLALGVGGFPRGRIVEVYGAESSGKTTLALEVIAQAQKKGGRAAYIDAEHALDPEYARKIGVDIDQILISQPDSGEDALNIVERLVKSALFDVLVVDSVAALVPRVELEGEIGDQHIGLQARLMSQALRKLTGIISKTKTILIFLNQTRTQIGMMYGAPITTPGGKALKFYASVRVELKRVAQIKKGAEIVGNRVRAKVVKNKVAPPFRTAEFDINFNEGISLEGDLLLTGEQHSILKKTGHTYLYGDTRLGGSFDAARAFLKEHPDIAKEILEKIKSAS